MNKPTVYLAGPISNKSYNESIEWRNYVASHLQPEIDCFSPLRGAYYLKNEKNIASCYDEYTLSTQEGIFTRGFYDCQKQDLIFVNLLGATKISIGTVMEIAWGKSFNKPIVLIMEKDKNPHDHPFIRAACPFRVETLEDGILITRSILLS